MRLLFLARATELANSGMDVINLGIGQPDFQTPGHIVEAAIKALRDGHHGYTPGEWYSTPEGSGIAANFEYNRHRGFTRKCDDRAGWQGDHVYDDPDVWPAWR